MDADGAFSGCDRREGQRRKGDLDVTGGEGIKVGCCGFSLAQKKYFELFRLVEIQQHSTRSLGLRRLKMAQAAPQNFEFTMKAWQLITHEPWSPTYRRLNEKIDPSLYGRYGRFRNTPEVFDAWSRTADFAQTLEVIRYRLPVSASFSPIPENVNTMREFSAVRTGWVFVSPGNRGEVV